MPSPAVATGPRQATLRPLWWTIPEEARLQMQAFIRPSQHMRYEIRAATLKSMYQTFMCMRLILQAKTHGAHTANTRESLHTRLRDTPKEGTNLQQFLNGQLCNGKMAKRYGHVPTDDCPLRHRPDACTHIACECAAHKNLSISRHNAACQLIHAAFRNSIKRGVALYSAEDLLLVAPYAGNENQTTEDELVFVVTPRQVEGHPDQGLQPPTMDWLKHLLPNADTRHRRYIDVSQDPRYVRATTAGDSECTKAPT